MTTDRRNLLLLVAVTAVLFFDVLFLGRGFYKGDLFVYHFPMKKVVRDLTLAGGLPQWNPAYHGGQPLAANPAYELFYPPQWLVYLPWYAFAFQLHIVLHFAIAAIGMYLFLRSLDVRAPAALFGAVAFAFGAPYLSLLIRLPFLFAMTWVPWVLMFARRAVLHGRARDIALGAIVFGMQAMLGEPLTVVQTGALAGSYALYHWIRTRDLKSFLRIAILLLGGFLIAAVQLVPAIDHARDSVRSEGFPWIYASNWSTPPLRLAELAYPSLFRAFGARDGSQAVRHMYPLRIQPFISEVYLGLLIAVAGLAGLIRGIRGRWYVLSILLVSLLLAFGEHTPLFRFIHDLGLTKSVRYPEKFLLSGLFVLIVWGAMMIDRLADDAKLRRTAIVLAAVWLAAGVGLWLSIRVPASTFPLAEARPLPWNAYWVMNVARGAVVLLLLATAGRKAKWWSAAVVVFAIGDAAFMHKADAARAPREFFAEPQAARGIRERSEYRLFQRASWQEVDLEPVALTHFLAAKEIDRVMRDAMFRFAPAAFRFRGVLEQDLDQTALLTSDAYLKAALDVKKRTGVWHPFFLESANVRWVAEFLPFEEANRRGQPIEIRDIGRNPRYWFATRLLPAREPVEMADHIVTSETRPGDAFADAPPFVPASGRVVGVDERPSRVRVDVESSGRAFFVAAVTAHKYWRATLDGAEVPIVRANIGFQGVVVPAGRHTIELRYRNPRIVPALVVSIVALAAAIAIALRVTITT